MEKRVKIKSKKYKLYKNFKWKKSKTKVYKKTYVAKYRYKHENGTNILHCIQNQENSLDISMPKLQKL